MQYFAFVASEGKEMEYRLLKIANILANAPEAAKFSFSFEPDVGALTASIQELGLINPPLVKKTEHKYEIICGFNRVQACFRLGIPEIPVKVADPVGLSDEKCLWLSLVDSEWSRRLSPVEQAIALQKFAAVGYSIERLFAEIAPHLQLPQSRRHLENHLRLTTLEPPMLQAIHREQLRVEQAFLLLDVEPPARLALFDLLQACKANLNETRELIPTILDVAKMKNLEPAQYIRQLEASAVSGTFRHKLQVLRDSLVKSRYPALSAAQSQFDNLAGALTAGHNCKIEAPRYLEGDEISISIRAKSPEQLEDVLRKLSRPESSDKIRSLFSILGGHT
ncbi:MAG: ParB/RepB/Spo0J family partition protein [Candidatus Abyssobacteria bacterium SURF_5]|uniref:ParB/RepB/Spo0J family partition protein n=1 Tax=Abyssobacteria bacterium (strain SURF_5) TaxID=2093360 RepID=A0A3A4NH95_ABYX5|nr:MAG: ParB/RepB/Spo0J family partition protein [Candidatus Abyssubacteria bacterium SURF_5]